MYFIEQIKKSDLTNKLNHIWYSKTHYSFNENPCIVNAFLKKKKKKKEN